MPYILPALFLFLCVSRIICSTFLPLDNVQWSLQSVPNILHPSPNVRPLVYIFSLKAFSNGVNVKKNRAGNEWRDFSLSKKGSQVESIKIYNGLVICVLADPRIFKSPNVPIWNLDHKNKKEYAPTIAAIAKAHLMETVSETWPEKN